MHIINYKIAFKQNLIFLFRNINSKHITIVFIYGIDSQQKLILS